MMSAGEGHGGARHVRLVAYAAAERVAAVRAFDARFGEMERVLWCLSVHARAGLLAGARSPVPEALVWTVKSWWGVQGVRSETRTQMARALESISWSPDLFGPVPGESPDLARYAEDCVADLVSRSMSLGVPRREYSLASKVLHWLMPWRIPVYDSFVRSALGVPASWDHPQAYGKVTTEIFAMAQAMGPNLDWIGPLEPRSPLRALDKLIWWVGGGNTGAAAEVRDPRRVLRELDLELHDSWDIRAHDQAEGAARVEAVRCTRASRDKVIAPRPRARSADLDGYSPGADRYACWPDLGILCAGWDQWASAARAAAVCVAPSGKARVTAAVRLDTCSLV